MCLLTTALTLCKQLYHNKQDLYKQFTIISSYCSIFVYIFQTRASCFVLCVNIFIHAFCKICVNLPSFHCVCDSELMLFWHWPTCGWGKCSENLSAMHVNRDWSCHPMSTRIILSHQLSLECNLLRAVENCLSPLLGACCAGYQNEFALNYVDDKFLGCLWLPQFRLDSHLDIVILPISLAWTAWAAVTAWHSWPGTKNFFSFLCATYEVAPQTMQQQFQFRFSSSICLFLFGVSTTSKIYRGSRNFQLKFATFFKEPPPLTDCHKR